MAGSLHQRIGSDGLLYSGFWLALLLTLLFSLTLGWLPVSGRFDLLYEVKPVTGFAIIDAWISDSPRRDEMLVSAIRHMVLPVLTLSVAPTTEVIRLMRISTIEVFDQNYVKAAATRGLSRLTILRRHGHCCKVSDEAAFCLIQRPYISKTLLTGRISPGDHHNKMLRLGLCVVHASPQYL